MEVEWRLSGGWVEVGWGLRNVANRGRGGKKLCRCWELRKSLELKRSSEVACEW